MKKEQQKTPAAYEAPKVEVIEVQVEQGFASSNPITGTTVEEDMGGGGSGSYPW